ncbi:MAG TPA: type II toxin-antitoxin system HicB family antitoxin [Pyrinomonadaceae bacterium]
MTELTLTTIFEEAEEGGYVGYVAELPGVNTQGESLEEVRESLGEAVELILSSNRERSEKSFSKSGKVTRERIVFRVV